VEEVVALMAAKQMNKAELIVDIDAMIQSIAGEFLGAVEPMAHRHLMDGCPEPRDIPVATLRRLHRALVEFLDEARPS
jgi:hypothetical protein